jgi:hypothetical protein
MKLDDDVKMISAEAPMLFAKAAEIFIHELTLRAWVHTEDNKRRTLQVWISIQYFIATEILVCCTIESHFVPKTEVAYI